MERKLRICFTSDNHGYLSPLDYASGRAADTGLSNCISRFEKDGNTLLIDGGDSLQGSPFVYYLRKSTDQLAAVPAAVMNIGGYDFFTLGNHDFNYGPALLQEYIDTLHARCLCANVEGLRDVAKTAVVTLENGLRVGLTGIVTHFVNVWERKENLEGLRVTPPVPCARAALEQLRGEGVDVTVCIYHGGFENDLESGAPLSDTEENQGYQICRELDFDVLLTGHQHIPLHGARLFDTFVCQTPERAKAYAEMVLTVAEGENGEGKNAVGAGRVRCTSQLLPAGSVTNPEAAALLAPLEEAAAGWLDTPVGHLDTALLPGEPIVMAEQGSYIANFFNQVQLEASGADISATCLANEVKGFARDVTVRDVVATYVYPNTLQTLVVNRAVLKAALERCAEYFALQEDGTLAVSEVFLKPKVEHYNFDFFAGIHVTADVRREVGDRIVSIVYDGEELPGDRELTLCLNNYRATGTGGYECYTHCRKVEESSTEIAELIMDYVLRHRDMAVDRTQWLHVIY